jgi:hypothetical protein
VGRIKGSPGGTATADLVDCGLAEGSCPGAAGKICLIQRGVNTFCEKVAACAAAGGIASILYNAVDKPACERFTGVDISVCDEGMPEGGWPLAVTVSRKQGEALRAALENATAAGSSLSVTLDVPDSAPQKEIGLAAFSGTSMVGHGMQHCRAFRAFGMIISMGSSNSSVVDAFHGSCSGWWEQQMLMYAVCIAWCRCAGVLATLDSSDVQVQIVQRFAAQPLGMREASHAVQTSSSRCLQALCTMTGTVP